MITADDRKAAIAVLEQAQFVFALSRYPKKQVLDDPRDVRALRERLEAMREAARRLSAEQRRRLSVPWEQLDDLDSGSEAVWTAAKKVTPKIIAELTPLVSDQPEAAFLIAPVPARRRKGQPEPPAPKAEVQARAPKTKPKTGLTGNEIAGLEMAIQQRAAADDAFFSWLRRSDDLPLAEWRRRRAQAASARRAEDAYLEKLLKARSGDR